MSPRTWLDGARGRFEALSSRDRRAIVIGAVIVVPALLWSGVVRPYLGALDDLRDRLATEQSLLEREQRILREAPELPAEIEDVQREITRLEERLVRAENTALAEAEISGRLERLARLNRVLLQEVRSITGSPQETVPEGIVALFLNVSGESDYEGVLDFLNEIEQDQLLMKVNELSVGPVSEADESAEDGRVGMRSGVMKFTATVMAYMFEPG